MKAILRKFFTERSLFFSIMHQNPVYRFDNRTYGIRNIFPTKAITIVIFSAIFSNNSDNVAYR